MRQALLAAALAALAACAPRRPPPDLSLDPAALLAQVEKAGSAVRSVQGPARVRIATPAARGSVPAFVAAERPDRLHVEALDFFGNPVAVLVAAGGRLAIYDAREKAYYLGAATAENVARLVPLPLSPERIVAILCGTPVLAGAPASAQAGRGFVALELREGGRTTSLRVGPRAAVLAASFRGGGVALPDHEVRYGAFVELDRTRFPEEVAVDTPGRELRVELAWREPDLAAPPDASLFRMEPPAGARVVDLDRTPEAPPPLPLAPEP